MILKNQEANIDYLVKIHDKNPKPNKQMAEEFVRNFNLEARKQKSIWFAEFKECKSMFNKEDKFILVHIHKKILSGWWIFKNISLISLHVGCYKNHYSFVDNVLPSGRGEEENLRFFKYLPEFINILKEIPEVFFILPKDEIYNYDLEVAKIKKDIEELELNLEKTKNG